MKLLLRLSKQHPQKQRKAKPKNPDAKPKERTEAQKEAQRNYYLTKLKNDPVYQAKQRESSKKTLL